MQRLTLDNIPFDKKIKWTAPSAEGNAPYGGIAIITDIQATTRPIIATIIEGDNLNHALCEDDVHIDFSDNYRGVMYEVIE